jgi:hypothetical protein
MEASSDRSAHESRLRAFHELATDLPLKLFESLIHQDAEMTLLVSYGGLLQGREAITQALETGREGAMYRASVTRFEWLDDQTVLTFAHARYALQGGGFAEGNVVWLDELRGRLIWRVEVFKNEPDARRTAASRP